MTQQSKAHSYRYWESSLFNETYLSVNFPVDYAAIWANTENGPFHDFYTGFIDLCGEVDARDFNSWTEADTISNWIKKIVQLLGWHDKCSPSVNPIIEQASFTIRAGDESRAYRPDMLLVDDPSQKRLIRPDNRQPASHEKAIQKVLIPIEAKYWNRLEEFGRGQKADKKKMDQHQRDFVASSSPNQQIIKYMEILERKWGILTDGRQWRLFNSEAAKRSTDAFYQFDLYALYNLVKQGIEDRSRREEFLTEARYFFFFFSKMGLHYGIEGSSIPDGVWDYSRKYIDHAEEDLRLRFVSAMAKTFNGFRSDKVNSLKQNQISEIRATSESYLFTVLFLKYCESRQILPVTAPDYKLDVSLSFIIDFLESYDPEEDEHVRVELLRKSFGPLFDFKAKGTELYDRTIRLIKSTQGGSDRTGKFGFHTKSNLIERSQLQFLQQNKISNIDMVDIIFQLGFARSNLPNRAYQQIPYSSFSPKQIGSIYESLLEYRLVIAESDQVEINGKWKKVSTREARERSNVCRKGEYFVERKLIDRKVTSSFYTKDLLVEEIVKLTIAPLIADKASNEIQELRVLDPSMGSGHFLSSALRYLGEIVELKWAKEGHDEFDIDTTALRAQLLRSCIYGFDINDRAVKLAKLSLWLETAQKGKQLVDLEGNLLPADTIIPKSNKYGGGFDETKSEFDAILSNPPWDKLKFDDLEFFRQKTQFVIPKTLSKTLKRSIFKKAMANKEIAAAYEEAKRSVDIKIEAVESSFYKHQTNISEVSKSRHIDHNLYKLAFERWLRLLKTSGRIGIVIPSGFLGDLGSSGIRKFMLDEFALEEVWGFEETAQVFPVSQACIYMILQAGSSTNEFTYVDNIPNVQDYERLLKDRSALPMMSQAMIASLDSDTWTISYIKDSTERNILTSMYRHCVQAGRLSFDFGRELHQTDNADDITGKRGLVRVLKGDEIDAFEVRDNGKQFLNETGLKNHALKKRRNRIGIRAIANRKSAKRLVACMVPSNMITVNSILVSKGDYSDDEIYFILAMLNSRVLEYRFRQIAKNNNVNKFAVNALPIPKYSESNKNHVALSRYSKRLQESGKGLSPLKADELDRLTADVFNLKESQLKFILKSFDAGKTESKVKASKGNA